jgi:tyrosine-protein phosphatase SIW14
MVRPDCALDGAPHPLTAYTVTSGIESVKASKGKIKGRPVNFGTVIPGLFYRSGYPQTEDHEYLKSLGLKTIM